MFVLSVRVLWNESPITVGPEVLEFSIAPLILALILAFRPCLEFVTLSAC